MGWTVINCIYEIQKRRLCSSLPNLYVFTHLEVLLLRERFRNIYHNSVVVVGVLCGVLPLLLLIRLMLFMMLFVLLFVRLVTSLVAPAGWTRGM